MNKFCLAFVCAVVLDGLAVGQGASGGDDYLEMGLRQAQRCRQRGWHAEAIPVYRQLLNSDLDLKDRIRVHVMLADCYQYVAGEGENARLTWREIRDAYPDDPVSLEAARRLGLLYFSATPRELKPSLPDAAEQFDYILERAPAGSRIALLAHMNLGQIRARMRQPERAIQHLRAIYDMQETQLEVPKEVADLPEEERERLMRPLREQLARMQNKVVPLLVSCHTRATKAESIAALNALKERYPDDPRIAEEVDRLLKRFQPTAEGEGETASTSVLLEDARNGALALLSVAAVLTLASGVGRWCRKVPPSSVEGLSAERGAPKDRERQTFAEKGGAFRRSGCTGRSAFLILGVLAFTCTLTCAIVFAAKHWDTAPLMTAPQIVTPVAQAVVAPGAHVVCTCTRGDQDHWTDGQDEGYDEDEMAEENYPAWYAYGVGSWLDDICTGTEVTYIAPDHPCEPTIAVTDDDKPKPLGQGETGSRNDPEPAPTERQIFVVDVKGQIAIEAFNEGSRWTDLVDGGAGNWKVYPDWTTDDYNAEIDGNPNTQPWAKCNVVVLKALLTSQIPQDRSIDVWFRVFDVDDPDWPQTPPADAVDDDSVKKSGDNFPEGDPGSLVNDKPDTEGACTIIKVTVTGGQGVDTATAYVVITQPYPGNNWRFAASTRREWLEDVYIQDGAQGDGITLKDAEGEVLEDRATTILTCWRYLHVEVDSMGRPEDNQPPFGTHIFGTKTGTSTDLTDIELTDAEADWRPNWQLVGSLVDPDTADTHPGDYVVTYNNRTTVFCAGATMRAYAKKEDSYAINTDDVPPDDPDTPDTSLLNAAFAPACITVVFDTGRNTANVPFEKTGIPCDPGPAQGGALYWYVYLTAGYEAGLDVDWDPNEERVGVCGGTIHLEPEYSWVFREVVRDVSSDPNHRWDRSVVEQQTVCHEVGHHFERPECITPLCLMRQGADPSISGPSFCAQCVRGIRTVGRDLKPDLPDYP